MQTKQGQTEAVGGRGRGEYVGKGCTSKQIPIYTVTTAAEYQPSTQH